VEASFLQDYLRHLVGMSPLLVADLVGFILCLVFWGRSPGAALLALLAICLLAANTLGMSAVQLWLQHRMLADGRPLSEVGTMLDWTSLARSSASAVGFVMLCLAVFIGRPPRRPFMPAPPARTD
jgi:hypothetical protein